MRLTWRQSMLLPFIIYNLCSAFHHFLNVQFWRSRSFPVKSSFKSLLSIPRMFIISDSFMKPFQFYWPSLSEIKIIQKLVIFYTDSKTVMKTSISLIIRRKLYLFYHRKLTLFLLLNLFIWKWRWWRLWSLIEFSITIEVTYATIPVIG